jgi:fermentation-respiration switch protein FrsA (DUF1100 family)
LDDGRESVAQRVFLEFVIVVAGALAGCSRLFFYPEQELLRTPTALGLQYEEVHFPSSDGVQLHGWFLPASGEAHGTLVFLHGNAENISSHVGAVYWLPARGFNVFTFDYRGFGHSQGKPDVKGAHLDAAAALHYVAARKDVDHHRVIVFGQSIGGAIALYTAATTGLPLRAVVAESTFTSYPGIMQKKLSEGWLTWPFQWIAVGMTGDYDPIAVLDKIPPAAILLIHGDRDRIIPVGESYQLFAAARGAKELWIVAGAGHIGAFAPGRSDYRDRFTRYLDEVLDGRRVSEGG